MDEKTLEYMGQRVDEARGIIAKIKRAIEKELDEL